MKIINPFQMNDWNIKKFLIFISSIQLLVWGLIGLDALNIQIPILRQLICFIYLTFIPGILILRIIRSHELGNIKTILYSLSLSIAVLMFTGFAMNIVYPVFHIYNPISSFYIIITISLLVMMLSIISYLKDKDYDKPKYLNTEDLVSKWFLILILFPFLSIFAAYFMNLGYNHIQMVLLIIISLIPLISLKWLPKKYFPLCIFVISLALLYRTSLISNHVWGADINAELYLSNLVLKDYFWNLSLPENVNATLSLVTLAPIYSLYLKMDIVWIFKIVYPFLFSLVPLGLYEIYRKQTSEKISFLACFFFVAFFAFYTVMPALARQQIAELFLTSIIMLFIDKNISNLNKSILLLIFGASMTVSHYSIGYLFIFMLLMIILAVHSPLKRFILLENKKPYNYNNYLLFFLVFTISWFMYISSASVLNTGVLIGNSILSSITDLLNPMTAQGLYIMTSTLPIFQSIERYLHILSHVFIGIGIIKLLKDRELGFYPEYKLLSIVNFILVSFGIILPFFAATLNSDRIYHIALFLLAPFFVIGFKAFFDFISNLRKKSLKIEKNKIYALIGVFLAVYFLFNSAFVYQVFDQPKMGRFALDNDVHFPLVNDKEISSINWLESKHDPQVEVYADVNKAMFLSGVDGKQIEEWHIKYDVLLKNSYIFLGTENIRDRKLMYMRFKGVNVGIVEYKDPKFKLQMSRIYDNGGSWILKS